MAAALNPSWNPLRCDATALPPNLLLMAKLVALTLLLTGHFLILPDPFLPFLPGLDLLPGAAFRLTLQMVFVASALALLFNRAVRAASLVLGLTILLAVVSSRVYYGNNKLFCGALLFLTGLQTRGRTPWLPRLQVVVLYFGAGLNKLLDPDWQSGVFFQYWAAERLQHPLYLAAAAWFPDLVLAKMFSWVTILIELGLVVALLVPRYYRIGIWGNILFQSALMFFTGTTFTMFFYATLAASLLFVEWPASQPVVLWDGDCGFCAASKRWWERFDFERFLEWIPFQDPAARRFGIPEQALIERLHLVVGERRYAGFAAFQMMTLLNPAFYFLTAVLLVLPTRPLVTALLLLVFLPPLAPVGEAVYNLVARNRHRLAAASHCNPSHPL
jgi:predicted DCC family thiol-disulfide oxidoreductase YuxK